MKSEIKDIIAEAEGEEEIQKTIMEVVMLGSGCIKSPTVKVSNKRHWEQGEDGSWQPMISERISYDTEAVSVFDIYPDPFAKNPGGEADLFRKHTMKPSAVRDLIAPKRRGAGTLTRTSTRTQRSSPTTNR